MAPDHSLRELVRRLGNCGYGDFVAAFNPLHIGNARWIACREQVPSSLRALVDLFLFSAEVEEKDVHDVAGDLIDDLVELGLVERRNERLAMDRLALVVVCGYWIFVDRPQVNPRVYIGDDTLGLLLRLRPYNGGQALDLCAGPGTQALFCSGFSDSVVAVELNPVAAAIARLNVAANAREDRVRVVCGNLFQPVAELQFDTIVANPPLLPFASNAGYPFVGDGGPSGMRVVHQILNGLPRALAPRGTAQLVATMLSGPEGLLEKPLLEAFARETSLNVVATIVSRHPIQRGTALFEGLVDTASIAAGTIESRASIAHEFERTLTEQFCTEMICCSITVSRGRGRLLVQEIRDTSSSGLWFT